VGERHGLGEALGAAGEEDHRRVPRRHAVQAMPAQPRPQRRRQFGAERDGPAHVLQQDQAVLDRRQVHPLGLEALDQPARGEHPLDAGQRQRVGHLARARGPVHHDRRLAGEQRGQVQHHRAHRRREHDAHRLARQRGDDGPQHQHGGDEVAIGFGAAGLVGDDHPSRRAARLGQEQFADVSAGRHGDPLGGGGAGEPAGGDGRQFRRSGGGHLAAGGQDHVAGGAQGVGLLHGVAELPLQPDRQVHLGQTVQAEVARQQVLGGDGRHAAHLLQMPQDDVARGGGGVRHRAGKPGRRRLRQNPDAAPLPPVVRHVGVGRSAGVVKGLEVAVQDGPVGGAGHIRRLTQLDGDGAPRREAPGVGQQHLQSAEQAGGHVGMAPRRAAEAAAPQAAGAHQDDPDVGRLTEQGLQGAGAAQVLVAAAVDPAGGVQD